jgi:hypothetical protein
MQLAAIFPDQKSDYMSKAKTLIDSALQQLDGKNVKLQINFIYKLKQEE